MTVTLGGGDWRFEVEEGPSLVHKTEKQELWIAFFHDPDQNPVERPLLE